MKWHTQRLLCGNEGGESKERRAADERESKVASLTAAKGEQQMSEGPVTVAVSYRSAMTELGGGELQIGDDRAWQRQGDEVMR